MQKLSLNLLWSTSALLICSFICARSMWSLTSQWMPWTTSKRWREREREGERVLSKNPFSYVLFLQGLEKFKNDTTLLTGIARVHEVYSPDKKNRLIWYTVDCQFPQGLGDLDTAVTHYRDVLKSDSTCVEAIACIATHHFYSDQPELALRFYRYTNFGPILM